MKSRSALRRIPAEEFVRIWQKAKSVSEVAAKCGRKNNIVSLRAWYLRKKGVPLKRFSVGRGPAVQASKLAKFAKQLAK